MTTSEVLNTNAHSVDRILNANLPVMLIFWRSSTPLTPVQEQELQELAKRYAGRAILARVNVDEEPTLAQRFRVATTPLYLLIRNGKPELALASEEARRNVAAWLAHFIEGKPQPTTPQRSAAQATNDGKPLTMTDANFEQTIRQPMPVLVDFWAPWCGPCRMVAPSVERLAQEFAGRAIVGKLNVDENPMTAQRYRVMSIPTLIIFKNGRPVDQIVGAQPYPVLQQRLAKFV